VSRLAVITVGLVALVVVATATATQRHAANLEPSERVRGMLVVQGPATRAQTALFGIYCEPDILKNGRYRRTCRDVPRVRRLFVGYGSFGSKAALSRSWNPREWSMWIDGERVSLDEFGTTDRTLYNYPPAGGKDVTLREWSVTLAHPTPGRHTIRYRFQLPQGITDATWEFKVAQT
jgi:hypothetical protein